MPEDIPAQRRDNGLRAQRFVALADVDPRLGDHLLDLLRLADIPAYLEPPADPRAARIRLDGPVERLFVHADMRVEARAVVVAAAAEAGPSTPPEPVQPARPDLLAGIDTDAEFERLMAGWSDSVDSPPADSPGISSAGALLDRGADEAAQRRRQDAQSADQAEDESFEEHFEAPEPPPMTRPSGPAILGTLAVALGFAMMAFGQLVGFDDLSGLTIGAASILAGAAILISRLRSRSNTDLDGDGDDGAVV